MRYYFITLMAMTGFYQTPLRVDADFLQSDLTPLDSAHLLGSDGFNDPGNGILYGVETIDNFTNVGFTPGAGQTLFISWAGAYFDRFDSGPLPLPLTDGGISSSSENFLPDPNPSFGIRFYSPDFLDPTLPELAPFFETFLVPEVFTYPTAMQTPGLEFHAFLAVLSDAPALNPNQQYFISIFETDNSTDPGTGFPLPSEDAFYWSSASEFLPGGDLQRNMSLGFGGQWESTGTDSMSRAVAIETAVPVPEPSTTCVLLLVLSGGQAFRRKRRDSNLVSLSK
jgi:hypothetical protein